MSELSPLANLKKLKADMANMTYTEKLTHIWTYYRWILVVVLVLILVASISMAMLGNLRKITLVGGVTVNVELSEEGRAFSIDDFKQLIGTGNTREVVDVGYMGITNDMSGDNYVAVMSLLALCEGEDLDYMILDQIGFEKMLIQGAYMSLDQVFTPEELTVLADKIIYAGKEGETEKPYAVNIADTDFVKDFTNENGPVYFAFVVNSPRLDASRDFFDYLMAYESK